MPHPSPQRHARSRTMLIGRVLSRVEAGHSLPAIARQKRMPRERTFDRWMDDDGALRARVEAARRACLQAMADEVIALADDYAARAPAKKRSVAVRMQIDARKWWARTVAAEMRDERRREAAVREAKTPDRDGRPDAEALRQRMDGYVELLRQQEAKVAAAASRRAAPNASEAAASDAARPAPEPVPTVVYAPQHPPEPSSANGNDDRRTDGGAGEKPGAAPGPRDGRAVPREPERPSAPLVPQWFLDETARRPEPPPYDPLRW